MCLAMVSLLTFLECRTAKRLGPTLYPVTLRAFNMFLAHRESGLPSYASTIRSGAPFCCSFWEVDYSHAGGTSESRCTAAAIEPCCQIYRHNSTGKLKGRPWIWWRNSPSDAMLVQELYPRALSRKRPFGESFRSTSRGTGVSVFVDSGVPIGVLGPCFRGFRGVGAFLVGQTISHNGLPI